MKIQSNKDKNFIRQLVALYSIDNILTDISDKEQEMGTYFLHSFADLRFHPIVFKHEDVWCINIHRNAIPQEIKDDEGKMGNIYESLYVNVLERINLIERLQDQHLIYLSTDIKKKYSINIPELLPEARKIEDPRLCELLDKFENTKIYPSDELIRLVANGFKSDDEKKYWKQYYLSIFAVLVAIALPIILNKCTSTKIDEEQIETIVKVINEKNLPEEKECEKEDSLILSIDTSNNDTIKKQDNGKVKNADH